MNPACGMAMSSRFTSVYMLRRVYCGSVCYVNGVMNCENWGDCFKLVCICDMFGVVN